MKPYLKNIIITLLLYGSFISMAFTLDYVFPVNMGNPGYGVVFLALGTPLFVLIMFLISIIKYEHGQKDRLPSFVINSLIMAVILVLILISVLK